MEQSTLARTCLVAVDGTAAGVDALVWALHRAADHDTAVDVLTVWPDHRSAFVREVPGHFSAPRWEAAVAQQDTIRRAADAVSTAPIRNVSLENADVDAAGCDVVVVGPHAHHPARPHQGASS